MAPAGPRIPSLFPFPDKSRRSGVNYRYRLHAQHAIRFSRGWHGRVGFAMLLQCLMLCSSKANTNKARTMLEEMWPEMRPATFVQSDRVFGQPSMQT